MHGLMRTRGPIARARDARVGSGRRLAAGIVAGCVAAGMGAPAHAILLTNGNLDDPAIHESDVATGWTLLEGPDSVDGTGAPFPTNTATFVSFGNHTPGGERGLWLRAFAGGLSEEAPDTVFAHLLQTVPAVPGTPYQLTAWSRWEAFYPGGVDLVDGVPSPTQTFLALEFLDAVNAVLASIELDLASEQANDGVWRQHLLGGVAPAGTVDVRVRASMLDGLFNPDGNPQSAFFDDFELLAVPEPAALPLVLASLGLLAARRRCA
jgi:hypothetical protein